MSVTAFESKKASEAILLSFDFVNSLDSEETLASGSIVSVRLVSGADPSPASLLMGDSSLVDSELRQWVQGGVAGAVYELTARVITSAGQTLQLSGVLPIDAQPPIRSLLFDQSAILPKLRADRLLVAMQGAFPNLELSDDYLWEKIIASEAETEHVLRVFLSPMELVPEGTAQSVVDALTMAGTRWAWEPGYDFEPNMFIDNRWGWITLRHRPLISVTSIVLAYPAPFTAVLSIPDQWMRLDRERGIVQMIPGSQYYSVMLPSHLFGVLSTGRMIPQMIQVRYRAGLTNPAAQYPELVDLVLKMAVYNIVEDSFLPGSGSIAADGLSQSLSYDISKYADLIEKRQDSLRQAIHGIRAMVV